MNRTERITTTHTFMKKRFLERIRALPIAEEMWPYTIVLTEGTDAHRPFGYSSVVYSSHDDKWAFFYCAETIVDITADLSDTEFEEWLSFIRAHTNAHCNLATSSESDADQYVYAVMPEARDLVARVHNLMFAI